jgi:hypothetical protein
MVNATIRNGHLTLVFPIWVWLFLAFSFVESLVRFQVAMSQHRGMGSAPGLLLYTLYWLITGCSLPSPFVARGESTTFMIAPPDDVTRRDSLVMRGPLITLLPAADQLRISQRHEYDYRQHAYGTASVILFFAVVGAIDGYYKIQQGGTVGITISTLLAVVLAIEQVFRLTSFSRRPAGSLLGFLVRPFMRDLLR